jgi:hypothetical protein
MLDFVAFGEKAKNRILFIFIPEKLQNPIYLL